MERAKKGLGVVLHDVVQNLVEVVVTHVGILGCVGEEERENSIEVIPLKRESLEREKKKKLREPKLFKI